MEGLSQLPLRLTKLYSDTKRSCDVVTEPEKVANVPELTSLHRKFRNQKDRLIAWGVEWSDESAVAPQGSIDESVARAGLTEVVTSVLGSIKEVLDEAEKIRCADKSARGTGFLSEKGMAAAAVDDDYGRPWAPSDKSRYEDLVRDLASSIDILYDLSRSRRAMQQNQPLADSKGGAQTPQKPKVKPVFFSQAYSASAETLVNPPSIAPSRSSMSLELPPKLDPDCLVMSEEEPPPYETIGIAPSSRVIGQLRRKGTATGSRNADDSKVGSTPVLIEFARFDAGYRETGVTPPVDRLERLLALLRTSGESTDVSPIGTLNCLGYFEDPKQPRFGLVFELPSFVHGGHADAGRAADDTKPATLLSLLQASSRTLQPVAPRPVPALEDRFRVAYKLARALSRLHEANFTHKDVNSSNVLFFRHNQGSRPPPSKQSAADYAITAPYLASFDLFSEYNIEPVPETSANIYRHPDDPKAGIDTAKKHALRHDMYSLGLILLEIGLWIPLSDIYKPKYTLGEFRARLESIWVKKLAAKCGTAYMRAVQDCLCGFTGSYEVSLEANRGRQVYDRICERLRRCCLLDENDAFAEEDARSPISKLLSAHPIVPKIDAIIPEEEEEEEPEPRPVSKSGAQQLKQALSPLKRRNLTYDGSPLTKSVSEPNIKRSGSLSKLLRRKSPSNDRPELRSQNLQEPPESPPSYSFYAESEFGQVYSASEPDLSTLYRDAVTVIQRAWRTRRDRISYKEYRHKIVIIQKHWRTRREIQSRSNTPSVGTTLRENEFFPFDPEVQRPTTGDAAADQFSIRIEPRDAPVKPKLRLYPVKLPHIHLDEWHERMLPRLERIVGKTLRDSPETVSIDLVGIGDSQTTARPTIMISCVSTGKVKAVIQRRFAYDTSVFDLKVRKGRIRRSKVSTKNRRPPHRSMMNDAGSDIHYPVLNPFHQERPLCGASIGAFKGEHLPPVSYGGVVLVDGEPLGMSVHHLLDAPSDEESEYDEALTESPTRSSGNIRGDSSSIRNASQQTLQTFPEALYPVELSDDEDDASEVPEYDSLSDRDDGLSADESADEADHEPGTPGDIPGIELGHGADIVVTQPAIDDVDENFFPTKEDRDDDHLSSHTLGHIHASSGIRRSYRHGIVHEIDWSLFKLNENRLQPCNLVQGGKRYCPQAKPLRRPKLLDPVCRRHFPPEDDFYPYRIAKSHELGDLAVHCFGRTSGLRGGIVGSAMSSVRIYRRRTFSRSWHIVGGFGVGGDSGAWVIDNEQGRVCGHVLAWCERNSIAYMCPMEVLLEDMKNSLKARHICLPGAEDIDEGGLGGSGSSGGVGPATATAAMKRMEEGGINLADIRRLSIGASSGGLVRSSMERMHYGKFDMARSGHAQVPGTTHFS